MSLYQIVNKDFVINGLRWKLYFYNSFNSVVESFEFNQSLEDILKFAEQYTFAKSYKSSIEAKSMHFTLGIYTDEKSVFMGTKFLSNELVLVQSLNSHSLKAHIEKIANIPVGNNPSVVEQLTFKYQLADFSEDVFNDVHEKTVSLTKELSSNVSLYKQSLFEKISDFGLDLTANFMLVRIHLLKFLAILPSLGHDKSGREIKRILLESMRRLVSDSHTAKIKKYKGQKRSLPQNILRVVKISSVIFKFIPAAALSFLVRFIVEKMAQRFIAGENIKSASKALRSLIDTGRDATCDQLGELVVSNKEADDYTKKVLELIQGMDQHYVRGARNSAGILQAHVSIKVSALSNDFKPYAFDQTYESVAPRLQKILLTAKRNEVFINIDAEHYHYRDIVLKIYSKVLREVPELNDYKDTGIVVQAYLKDSYNHFIDIVRLAKARNLIMPIRLVKGAYWDAETVEAQAHNHEAPQFLNKEETDTHFRQIIYAALAQGEVIQLAVASHNIKDHAFSRALRDLRFPKAPRIEHQCLHMTYEALSMGLVRMGWATRNYIPIGNLLVGMAYLVRRIMENSSQVGILTIMRSHKKAMDFTAPASQVMALKKESKLKYEQSISEVSSEFKNINPVRVYLEHEFHHCEKRLLQDIRDLNENKLFVDQGDIEVFSNSNAKLLLGKISLNTKEEIVDKIDLLNKHFLNSDWSMDETFRFTCLLKLGDQLLINRHRLVSIIMLEAGKTLEEAIADVDEAIDFINFYVREQQTIELSGIYGPRGVLGVIAPWNFPLAIACGMSVAALATGNTVILKPAEQTPIIALEFYRLCLDSGIPQGAFQLALGEGDIGKEIVNHKLLSGIVFTGSKEVGMQIYQKTKGQLVSDIYEQTLGTKCAITEMGGKNAIIVTNNCELDETISGIIYAAFAHAGQKCSACSRVIVDKKIKPEFLRRFIDAVKDIKIGRSFDLDTVVNPLVTLEDKERVLSIVSECEEEVQKYKGRVHILNKSDDYPGACVGPSVFELSAQTVLENETYASKEIFGPIIHVIPYENVDEAIEIFNSTSFALTGGIYCQSQDDIDYIGPKLEAGNIYINRPNTGARVAIEPFGGFKFSGTGPKAGSKDYLFGLQRIVGSIHPDIQSQINDEEEGEIEFDLTNSSKLLFTSRRAKLNKFLTTILTRYEEVFQEINEIAKNELDDFQSFINGYEDYTSLQHRNRYIPGQTNYDLKDMNLGRGIFIQTGVRVEVDCLFDILINLYLGNGVNIICTNQMSYSRWQMICNLMYQEGFSPFNIRVNKAGKNRVKMILENDDINFVILEPSIQAINEFRNSVVSNSHSLVKLFISSKEYVSGDWERGISIYTNSRSFAINTMRHGAPLEIEI